MSKFILWPALIGAVVAVAPLAIAPPRAAAQEKPDWHGLTVPEDVDQAVNARELLSGADAAQFDRLINKANRTPDEEIALARLVVIGLQARDEYIELIVKHDRTPQDEARLQELRHIAQANQAVAVVDADVMSRAVNARLGKSPGAASPPAGAAAIPAAAAPKVAPVAPVTPVAVPAPTGPVTLTTTAPRVGAISPLPQPPAAVNAYGQMLQDVWKSVNLKGAYHPDPTVEAGIASQMAIRAGRQPDDARAALGAIEAKSLSLQQPYGGDPGSDRDLLGLVDIKTETATELQTLLVAQNARIIEQNDRIIALLTHIAGLPPVKP